MNNSWCCVGPLKRVVLAAMISTVGWSPVTVADDLSIDAAGNYAFFENRIHPILVSRCYECHSQQTGKSEGGLTLDSRAGWADGGDSGPAIVPGMAEESLLVRAVGYRDAELQMPPDGRLTDQQISDLREWVRLGATDPRTLSEAHDDHSPAQNDHLSDHWSLQPTRRPSVPRIDAQHWVRCAIDHFVLEQLEAQRLAPAIEADRYTLLRRVTFDLTGLPPTLPEIQAFINDTDPGAFEHVVDRLLTSPHYGERWGRYWFDLARYADSNGADINYGHANAWRYRDYVIRSFNAGKPYDQFVVEQLAGDLIPDLANESEQNDRITATGFLLMGPKMLSEVDTAKLLIDVVDEQMDVAGRTFLGMTFGCARCHDHKFDPITTRDYYALAGIFRSTRSIAELRDAETKMPELQERNLQSRELASKIEQHRNHVQRVEQQLAELGATVQPAAADKTSATQAVQSAGLPEIKSTTWTAWVRLGASRPNLDAVISANYAEAEQGHSLGFHDGATAYHPRIVWNHGTGNHRIIRASLPIRQNEWHHLALTFDHLSERLKLFVDGDRQATAEGVESTPFSVLGVGRREASRAFGLSGDVDEVLIYDRPLPPKELAMVMRGKGPHDGLILHWNFDRFERDRIQDESGNGHAGRLVGFDGVKTCWISGRRGRALSFRRQPAKALFSPESAKEVDRLRAEWNQLKQESPSFPRAMAVALAKPSDMPVLARGSHLSPGDVTVPRGMPKVFQRSLPSEKVLPHENGRLQLARWITHPRHPLTARVMVNRIWQGHFGHGLVRTPSNFGLRGDRPSHPKLLDWLASEFMQSGWSIKHMHRQIVLSSTYRMNSHDNPAAAQRDPSNRLRWRQDVRRLEVEVIRDALFSIAGNLDKRMGGSLLTPPNYKTVRWQPGSEVYDAPRRAIYLPLIRVSGYPMFSVFDFQTSGQHLAQRSTTVTPQQALFLLNNPLVLRQADELALQVLSWDVDSDQQRVRRLYLVLFGRPATNAERELAGFMLPQLREVLTSANHPRQTKEVAAWSGFCHVLFAANEFMFVK